MEPNGYVCEVEARGETEAVPGMSFPAVGIGASAGGLEAVSELLAELPATTGMAFLLVQHLAPGHDSMLAEILTKKTALTVAEVQDGMAIAPDHLYVIPPNTTLTLSKGALRLQRRQISERRHMPIDTLLHSLAEDRGQFAIGVILSGGGADGALGLREIKGRGGITFAQEPASARFSAMPRSAIATGCVDFILPPQAMAEALARIGRHPYLSSGTAPIGQPPASVENDMERVFRLLQTHCGVDFSHYKRATIGRRLARRLAVRQVDGLASYADLLQHDADEVQTLGQDLLIRVTAFFRDHETFEGLVETIFPALLEGRSLTEPLRIWAPGCATGEEVYSIAICLTEFLESRDISMPIQVFGTDLSEAAIETARAGQYLANIAGQMSAERLERFFIKLNAHYQIVKSIRDRCVFARQSVTSDPPFSRLELLCCRNLLIYLDPDLQSQVIPLFHYALKPHGYLVLGPSETIGPFSELFELVDKHHKIYRRKASPTRIGLEFRAGKPAAAPAPHETAIAVAPALVHVEQAQRETEHLLLARYAPACILIDEGLNILYFHGETSHYLEHARGPASLNLQKLASPGLLVELVPAIQSARQENAPVQLEGLRVETSGEVREMHVEVIPLKVPEIEDRCYVILFAQPPTPSRGELHTAAGWFAQGWGKLFTSGADAATEKDREILKLKRELDATRGYLQATIEEHQSAKEDLKSAHEEVLSANEELQSTNEELETAKEELQSTNEELTTTNEELQNRNGELNKVNEALSESSDYLDAIVETLRQPLLVLSGDLRIARANRAFYACFQTTPAETEHCLLYELGDGQWDIPRLRTLLEEILGQNAQFQDYEVANFFPRIGEKTMLLNARKLIGDPHRAGVILLAIEDISERKRMNDALAEHEALLRTIIEAEPNCIMLLDTNGALLQMNRAGLDLIEADTFEQARATPLVDLVAEGNRQGFQQLTEKVFRGGQGTIEYEVIGLKGATRWLDTQAVPIRDRQGEVTALLGISRDISEKRQHSERLSYQATHDSVTGLINRTEFERRLNRVLTTLAAGTQHALLYLDLDQFKIVNDTSGHMAGDEMLRQIAALMGRHIRKRDTLARLGGDEFGVLLEHCTLNQVARVAGDLRQALEDARFAWEDKSFMIGVSIGLVPIPEGGDTLEAVLRAADQACYAAKEQGRNRVHTYVPSDRDLEQRHGEMQWVGRIQEALAEGRFQFYFQPIVSLRDEAMPCDRGEILLRLRDVNGQLVRPGAFIPAAERYQQMQALDRWVIRTVLPLLRARRSERVASYGINVSGQSLGDQAFLDFTLAQLDEANVLPTSICFEITETALVTNLEHARHFISTLTELGCQFALDDFGTGLSSFEYLKTLRVDYLKIGGAFIKDILDDPIADAMVRSMCQIGQAMGLKIIAESVETKALLEHLKAINVDYAQGYALAEPSPLEIVVQPQTLVSGQPVFPGR